MTNTASSLTGTVLCAWFPSYRLGLPGWHFISCSRYSKLSSLLCSKLNDWVVDKQISWMLLQITIFYYNIAVVSLIRIKHTWIKHNDICAIHRFAHKLSKSFLKHGPSFIGTLFIVFTATYFATIFGSKFRLTRSWKIQKFLFKLDGWKGKFSNFKLPNINFANFSFISIQLSNFMYASFSVKVWLTLIKFWLLQACSLG